MFKQFIDRFKGGPVFLSEDEILNDIISNGKLSEADAELIFDGKTDSPDYYPMKGLEQHLATVAFTRWIRNSYGLWDEANPHTVLNPAPNDAGIIDHPSFPDNISGRIFDRLADHYRK